MIYLVTKTLISALILVAVSEIAKKSPFWGGLLASLPLVSLLAMIWLYLDTKSVEKIAETFFEHFLARVADTADVHRVARHA